MTGKYQIADIKSDEAIDRNGVYFVEKVPFPEILVKPYNSFLIKTINYKLTTHQK